MIVISYFSRPASPSLANHRGYARRHHYRHEWIDASAMPDSAQSRCIYKYQALLNILKQAAPGEPVLLLTENAAIIEPARFERFLGERDHVIFLRESGITPPLEPEINIQIWRNTEEVRRAVNALAKRCGLGGEDFIDERHLFAGWDTLTWNDLIDGMFPVMRAGFNVDPLWSRERTFCISIINSPPGPPNPQMLGVNSHYRDTLVNYINVCSKNQQPLFTFPEYDNTETAERSNYYPGNSIALMTLYTPHVAPYARVAERNFLDYCKRQNYSLYIHRDVPAEVGMDASGNWFKPWLLRGYMDHHEWVVWLDADVLIADLDRRLEPLLEGRDILLAKDIGQWTFNSGVMGFRRTDQNRAMLEDLMQQISGIPDRSAVGSSGGDQHHFIEVVKRHGLLNEDDLMEQIVLNTYWEYRRPDSFIVHYAAMEWAMRAMMMAHDVVASDD